MPADPAAVPPPEWAVEMAFAHTFPADYKAYGYAKARDVWKHLEGTSDWRRLYTLARLLASVREAAIREAAEYGGKWQCDGYAVKPAILSLLHTPPSGGGGA